MVEKNLTESVKSLEEKSAKKIYDSLKDKRSESLTLDNFIADYLHVGRFCVLNTKLYAEVLHNFLQNFNALKMEMENLDAAIEKMIKSELK